MCKELERRLEKAIDAIEQENKVRISYKYRLDKTMRGLDKLSVNPAGMPIMLINGRTEFAAGHRLPTDKIIKQKLLDIMRFGHMY